jgi:hypothetical protein
MLFPLMVFYTRHVYRRLARQVANQIQDYLASGFEVLGVIGVDGSPSCGMQTTMNLERAFVQVGRLQPVATVADVNAIVRSNAIGGRGLFVALLEEELRRRSLTVPFAAHDLMAELEGRRFVSAVDTLTSTGVHR